MRGPRRRRQVDERVEHFLHAEVVDRRAEEHRRLLAGEKGARDRTSGAAPVSSSISSCACSQLHAEALALAGLSRSVSDLRRRRRRDPRPARNTRICSLAQVDRRRWKRLPMPTGQVNGTTLHAQLALDLVDQLERLPHFAVHLVDEGEDRRVARAADLQQAARLRLDAVGRVDHHQRRRRRRSARGRCLRRSPGGPGVSSRLMTQSRYSICMTD